MSSAPDPLQVPRAQVDAIMANITEEMLAHLCVCLAAACSHPQFIGEGLKVSTLSTSGDSGDAVAVTFNRKAWDRAREILAEHGGLQEF
jgi:hypothetical protein